MRAFSLRILVLAVIPCLLTGAFGRAQTTPELGQIQGKVVDARGEPLAGSTISDASGKELAITGTDGVFEIPAGISELEVRNARYVTAVVAISVPGPVR